MVVVVAVEVAVGTGMAVAEAVSVVVAAAVSAVPVVTVPEEEIYEGASGRERVTEEDVKYDGGECVGMVVIVSLI